MKDTPTAILILSFFSRFLGVFLIIFSLMAAILGASALRSVSKDGTIGLSISTSSNNSAVIVSATEKGLPVDIAGIQIGDSIVKYNGSPITPEVISNQVMASQTVGDTITLTIRKNGAEKDYELIAIRSSLFDKLITVMFKTIPVLLMMLYILVGFWGLIKSPYSKETILIALFCFCFGCFSYATINTGLDAQNFIRKYLYFDELKKFVSLIMWFGPSFWVLLFATFPSRNRFYERNKKLTLFFIFLLPLIVILSMIIPQSLNWLGIVLFTLLFTNMGIGVMLLGKSSHSVGSVLEKRQVRLMLFGIKYGAISIALGWMEILIIQLFLIKYISTTFQLIGFLVFLTCQVGGLIIPFTFLNSFFQNKLLETQSALKRRVRYIGFTLGLLAIYLFAIFLIGNMLVNLLDVKDTTLIIILVLLLSLTFTPINKRLLRWIDEKFYPERTKYAESLKSFIHSISAQIDKNEILIKLKDWMQTTTNIFPVIPITMDANPAMFYPFKNARSNSVINKIRYGGNFFWDEVTAQYTEHVDEEEIEWARDNDISLSIPMISQGELVGVLNVGKKQGEDDFTMEDIDLLSQASSQTAIALQNIKLQSEYIDKKRMDKELEMARRIQENLMPKGIPQVSGLDVHGESRPCYEIAGDYFDVIKLEDGNTALVVADVSGKGAGAAMIMANLQASIRLGVQLSDEMGDFVTRINNLIYNNTSPSEFITFFFALWIPTKKIMYYVNAGHNPPVLINANGEVTKLHATGLIIGVLPDQVYTVGTLNMNKDTVLVIYTDGLDEAMNKMGEQFGLDRIIENTNRNKDKTAAEIARAINDEVSVFCEGVPMHDDVTLIVAKGK